MPPLRTGSAEQFRQVRQCLERAGFREQPAASLLGLTRLSDILDGKGGVDAGASDSPLGLLARLFLLGDSAPVSVLERVLPAETVSSLRALGLVVEEGEPPGQCFAPVLLAPVGEFYFVSDRVSRPDRKPFVAPGDMVFAAVTPETGRFLRLLPNSPCERLLDLGSGTGVGAVAAAGSGVARRAWAADITARATHFAAFNAQLNGVEAVCAVEGDLYAPVAGLVFDRIIAHPPYVPALKTQWVFRDAGEMGEAITRRIVAGLPEFLEPGGRLYCLTTALDMKDRKLDARVREWLGGRAGEFDILLVEFEQFTLKNVAADLVLRGQRASEEGRALLAGFEKAGADRFVHALIVIQRHAGRREPFVVRKTAGRRTGSAEIEWLLAWRNAGAASGFEQRLLEGRYTATESFSLNIAQRFEDGALAVAGMELKTEYPFETECEIQPWAASFLAACGQPSTGFEIYEFCRAENLVRGEVSPEEFTELLRSLVDSGFLELQGFKLPGEAG